MAKKQIIVQGAPDWVLTYGDLMSLLLCFFILLAAFANYDTPNPKLEEALEAIRSAFGIPGQSGIMKDPAFDMKRFVQEIAQAVKRLQTGSKGKSELKGVIGRYVAVRHLREGAEITMGGPIAFPRFSAELQPDAAQLAEQLGKMLSGHLNKVEIRGHATNEPLPPDSPYRDPMDLSIARARAVANWMVRGGLSPCVVRIVGVGASEPAVWPAYTEEQRAANRRVEVMVRESLAADYEATASRPAREEPAPEP